MHTLLNEQPAYEKWYKTVKILLVYNGLVILALPFNDEARRRIGDKVSDQFNKQIKKARLNHSKNVDE